MSSSTVANNSRSSRSSAPHVSSFLGKYGSVGLEVLDSLISLVLYKKTEALHARTFFSKAGLGVLGSWLSNSASTNNEVSVLAFEVANTILKGSNLMQSLSNENIQILKDEILLSKGVRLLVSTDINELLRIAAADKREELGIFSREVVRFGDMSIDPQWHNLDRFFHRLDLDTIKNSQQRKEADILTMQELFNLAQRTIELYHECHVLDGLEQIFRRNLEKGESLMILQSELKHQTKLVKNLKKKSLWSKSLEEVVEKLVDVVTFIHQTIVEAFGENDSISPNADIESNSKIERLGAAGLSLHYANLITQIDSIASRPMSFHPNMRDTLYNSLPASVKACLRSRLQALDSKKMMTMPEIMAEMEKTLHWLAPVAINTTKAHLSFGWIGEWANTGFEFGKKTDESNNIKWLQTLYHADKHKTDQYILDLVILLHRLINLTNAQL